MKEYRRCALAAGVHETGVRMKQRTVLCAVGDTNIYRLNYSYVVAPWNHSSIGDSEHTFYCRVPVEVLQGNEFYSNVTRKNSFTHYATR